MFIEIKESPSTAASQFCIEQTNMPQQQVDGSDFLPPGVQRWVSEPKVSSDSSPTPPMYGLRRWSSEGNHLNHMEKQRALSRRNLCLDDDDCAAPPPLLQRWSSEWEGSLDECPAPPSCGLRRLPSESGCGPAYNNSALSLPESDKEPDFVRPPTRSERWASESASIDSLDESPTPPMPRLQRWVSEGHATLSKGHVRPTRSERWASESASIDSLDESPTPPMPPRLQAWVSEGHDTLSKSHQSAKRKEREPNSCSILRNCNSPGGKAA
jgi:hypothetical protein